MEKMEKFAIATFCYGKRYQNQVNKMISEIDACDFKPTVVVVTDDIKKINSKSFVKVYDVSDFNPEYKNYSSSYYDFDFSVKRYSLLAALNLGFTKIILSDADAIPNKSSFTEEKALKGFIKNSIQGRITYNFSKEFNTDSALGKRFLSYENYFGVSYDKNQLNFMPEDCIQFLDIEMPKFYNFLRVWDECITYKKKNNLDNIPAGNIDEMCFAALKCGITVGDNSNKVTSILVAMHDRWYANDTSCSLEIKTKKKNVIVTSIYELNYIDKRGSGVYKNFDLLTETIRSIIFDEYDYIIYTNKFTFDKHALSSVFNYPNVTIKIYELDADFYTNHLEPIRHNKNTQGEIWDRIFCVKNYVEVMYNKFEFLVQTAKELDANVCWVDAGLFGTSCHSNWRDYLKLNVVHDKKFVDKIFEKINEHEFIALKGNDIAINYEVKDKINAQFGIYPFIVPGGLFGGSQDKIIEYLGSYKEKIKDIIDCLDEYTSDQELMCLLLQNKKCKFYEFNDWDDLQRGILKMMDLYDESSYLTHTCYKKDKDKATNAYESTVIPANHESMDSEITITHPLTDREILEEIIKVSNSKLDNMDLTHNDYMLKNMLSFAQHFHCPSGREHYRLLSFISKLYNNEILCDIGTCNGCSAISLSEESTNIVKTFDIFDYKEPGVITKFNIEFYMKNLLNDNDNSVLKNTRFIMLDLNHDGVLENQFYSKLKEINYKGILFLDDIHLNPDMILFWDKISEEKYDLTSKGHCSGTGVVIFE